jgi:long-subunit fatty acid transport protein
MVTATATTSSTVTRRARVATTASRFSLFQLYVTLGAALRITDGWYIGFSASYVFGSLQYAFVRDAALFGGATRDAGEYIALDDCGGGQSCGYGNDRAAEAIRISGTSNALGFAAGLIGRVHPDVVIGVGYVSALVGLGGNKVPSDGSAWIRRSEALLESAQAQLGSVARDLEGRSLVNYQLPDIVSAGVTWRVRPRLSLSGQLRWMTYRRHDRLDIRLSGRQFQRDPRVPQQLVHYRGFHDVVAGQLGALWRVSSRLSLAGALMVESSAVDRSALTAIAAEGTKLDMLVAARVWLTQRLSLRVGLGLIWVPTVDNDSSDFDPSTLPACVDARFDVDNASCKQAAAGRGLASSAGSYGALTARLGLGLSYDWR